MRPDTLAEAVARIALGVAPGIALAEFIDTFDLTLNLDERYARLSDEPQLIADEHINAYVGGIAEYLAKQRRLGRVPPWTSGSARRLQEPWHMAADQSAAMREYLTFASPAEFASRNIFTEARPLRRARGPAPGKPDFV